jgi:hypothetical protein
MDKLILCPNTETSPPIRLSDEGSCNEMIWENGQVLDSNKYDFSRLEFICERLKSRAMTDYAVTDMGCPIVSERLKTFFENNNIDNIQYFQATVIESEGKPAKGGYYAANFIGLVDCIDRDASETRARRDDNGELNIITRISKLALKDLEVSYNQLYRVYAFTRLILIDSSFKEKIDAAGLTGIRLVDPERWDGQNGERTANQ